MNKKIFAGIILIILLAVPFCIAEPAVWNDEAAFLCEGIENPQIAGGLITFAPLIVAVMSIAANCFKIKETDSDTVKVIKKLVNLLAFNVSKNAGQ